ncbi:hypothetical protein HMPREF1872_01415 [Amygdalobacter nucleatus]|uniref:Uncharacterized protein n=1 Tax=Amygdalobacter nucleatus TaxID=3029274 RepID=A0A133Y6V3_9FIRM|nr:hypothetical protein HMPREF1872_01415 [Amygdalobacter nucleatus]
MQGQHNILLSFFMLGLTKSILPKIRKFFQFFPNLGRILTFYGMIQTIFWCF